MAIEIVCSDRSHEPKIAKIARFTFAGSWELDQPSPEVRSIQDYARLASPSQAIREDQEVRGVEGFRAMKTGDARERFQFECPLCGFNVTVTRDTLAPILVRFQEASVDTVSLVMLSALL